MKDKIDHTQELWSVLGRIDGYIEAVNTKASLLLAYCGALLFGVAVNADKFSKIPIVLAKGGAISLMGFAMLMTTFAMIGLVWAVIPDLRPGRGGHENPSLIFFQDIAGGAGGRDAYQKAVVGLDRDAWFDDLSRQVHANSCVASKKFKIVGVAGLILIFGSILPAGISCFLLLIYGG